MAMTKGRKSIFLLLLVLIGLTGCFEFRIPDINQAIVPPTMGVGPYEFYVTSQSINFDDLLSLAGDQLPLEDMREVFPEDLSGESDWFVYRYDMNETFNMDLGMSVDAVSSSISQSMILASYATQNISLSDPIEMQDLIDLSLLPDGAEVPVDSIEIEPDTSYMSFPMTRQRFATGTLEVTIDNDLECDLGAPISMLFYDSLTNTPITYPAGDSLKLEWTTPISPGSEATENASLVGIEFPKHVMVITQGYAAANGGDPDTLTVSPAMRTSSFNVTGAISNLEADLVEGDIESQNLNESSTLSFGDAVNQPGLSVEKVYLAPSHVSITINNTSSITGKMLLELASLDTSLNAGIQAFNTDSLAIPSEGTHTYYFPLNNASVDLSSDFEYSAFIHTPAQYTEIESDDEFEIEFAFYGTNPGDPIEIQSVDASFTDASFELAKASIEGFNLGEVFPSQFSGIELASVELTLDISSTITVPMTLDLELIGVKNAAADSTIISISQQITGVGGNPHIVIPNAADLINFMPDSMFFGGGISLSGSGNEELTQNVGVDIEVAVPLEFIINTPIEFPLPYIPLEKMDPLPDFLNDFTGMLTASVDNNFRFGVDLNVYAAHDTMYFNNPTYIDCVRTLAELELPVLDTTTQYLVLTKADYDFLAAAQDSNWLLLEATLNGRNDGQATTFVSTDSISVELFIRAEGTIAFDEIIPDTTGGDQ